MKICLVNKFHYIKGGSETYYFGLAALLQKRGHEVIFFSMKDDKNIPCSQEKYFVENVDFNADMNLFKLAKTSIKMLYSFEAKKKFEQLIEEERPDIIHLNIFQSQLTGSIIDAARKYNIPIVYTAHDLKSICPNYQMLNHGNICEKCINGDYVNCFKSGCMKDSRLKSLLATLEAEVYKNKQIYKKVDWVITPSNFYKRKIEEAKVFNCPIVHIPNFLPEKTEYFSISKKGDYFLYFGRLSKEKGVLTLIEAYALSNIQSPLYIVGTGPIENQVKDLVQKYELGHKIHLLGFKTGKELTNIISNALCVCLPSEWYENGPYSIMEAQALGRPVLVSNNGGLPELVEDAVTGFVVKPKDVKDLSNRIVQIEKIDNWNNDKIVEFSKDKYNPENYLSRLEIIYNNLCRSREV